MKDGESHYYILKVEHHDLETLCFYPDAGLHFTEHTSGEAHIQAEKGPAKGIPIAVTTGEAGPPCGSGFEHENPQKIGAARSISGFYVLLDSLDSEYRKYHRNVEACLIIDRALLPDDTSLVYIGVWHVPTRNEFSFWWNNKDISDGLLHKVTQCEPQIWVFAKPVA
jgi:hypothetical protein